MKHPMLAALLVGLGAWAPCCPGQTGTGTVPLQLSKQHIEAVARRKVRIVVQQDVEDSVVFDNQGRPQNLDLPFTRFRDTVFAYVDQPGSQIDAIWWDIAGAAPGPTYPSKVLPPVDIPLLQRWLAGGTDWVREMVRACRARHLEVFWNDRISEVDGTLMGRLEMDRRNPLKAAHPDWVTQGGWWWQGMWNLQSPGLREHKLAILRELAANYDFDGFQIDFSRHTPFLPIGRQWKLRDCVTQFMRSVRVMLLEEEKRRGHPILLAAKVPETLLGCHVDGLDVQAWTDQHLVDVLTLGSRTMDVKVEEFRRVVGPAIQLQPCFDDHHATDGYRFASLPYLCGVFANHWQRGADSVVTFNWGIAPTEVANAAGVGPLGPPTHQEAYLVVGDPRTLAGRDKIFAVERRGGYPWSNGYFNRNDTAPLPRRLDGHDSVLACAIHISDALVPSTRLTLRCVIFDPPPGADYRLSLNGHPLAVAERDDAWKDPQIFSPLPQPNSGRSKPYEIDPKQRLLRIDCLVPPADWRQGTNEAEIRGSGGQVEKIEARLAYSL